MRYNTENFIFRGVKYCIYCGKEQKKYEDRSGCDYREDGYLYYFCDCEDSNKEIEYQKEIHKEKQKYNLILKEKKSLFDIAAKKINQKEISKILRIKECEEKIMRLKEKD